jgi:hypothetical protein
MSATAALSEAFSAGFGRDVAIPDVLAASPTPRAPVHLAFADRSLLAKQSRVEFAELFGKVQRGSGVEKRVSASSLVFSSLGATQPHDGEWLRGTLGLAHVGSIASLPPGSGDQN